MAVAVAIIGLPLWLNGLVAPTDPSFELDEALACVTACSRLRTTAAQGSIAEIEHLEKQRSDPQPDAEIALAAATCIVGTYLTRFDSRAGDAEDVAPARRGDAIRGQMRLASTRADRSGIVRNLSARRLGSDTARAYSFKS